MTPISPHIIDKAAYPEWAVTHPGSHSSFTAEAGPDPHPGLPLLTQVFAMAPGVFAYTH